MKVSVIIPAYNVGEHIAQTLRSLSSQTLADFEAIVVDDGSLDDTAAIIDGFCAQDARFRREPQVNAGVSAARNRGLDLATGEYIAFLDGDDEFTPTALQTLVARAEELDADQVIGNYEVFDDTHSWHVPAMDKMLALPAYPPLDEALIACYVIWNRLYRRSRIEEIGLRFEPLAFAEDSVFSMSFTYRCNRIATVRDDVYRYRRRSLSGELSATQVISLASERDHQAAHAAIRQAATARFAEEERFLGDHGRVRLERKLSLYTDALQRKEAGNELSARYARLWAAEDGVGALIGERVEQIRQSASLTMWDRLVRATCHVSVEALPITPEAVADSAQITVIAEDDGSDPAHYLETLESLLNQRLANLVVYVPEDALDVLGEEYRHRQNLRVLPQGDRTAARNSILDRCTTDYLLIAQGGIVYRPSALQRLLELLRRSSYDFVAARVTRISSDKRASAVHPQDVAFWADSAKRGLGVDNAVALDALFPNKLLRVSYLRTRSFRFSGSDSDDMRTLYRNSYHRRVTERLCGTRLADDAFVRRFLTSKSGAPISYRKAHLYRTVVSSAKRTFAPLTEWMTGGLVRGTRHAGRRWKGRLLRALQVALPVREKVFFYSIRANGRLTGNAELVYDRLTGVRKTFAAHVVPHDSAFKLRAYYHLLTSRVIVTDDYVRYLRGINLRPKQKVVQLWHATGAFKTFGLDGGPHPAHREILTHRQYDAVLVSSQWVGERYAHAFGIPADRALPLGVARTDALLDEERRAHTREQLLQRHPKLRDKRVLLYAPTFRDVGAKRGHFDSGIDFADLSSALPEGTVLVVSRHPVITGRILCGAEYPNIFEPDDLSTADAMMVADVLITDYSTVIFDFALLRRPVVLYCPDLDDYDRSFYFDFPEQTGAPVARDYVELRGLLSSTDTPLPEMDAEFVRMQMGACDGHSTERAVDLIWQYLGAAR